MGLYLSPFPWLVSTSFSDSYVAAQNVVKGMSRSPSLPPLLLVSGNPSRVCLRLSRTFVWWRKVSTHALAVERLGESQSVRRILPVLDVMSNESAHTDRQHQAAASRRMLYAGSLGR